jgi:hypothetical protein
MVAIDHATLEETTTQQLDQGERTQGLGPPAPMPPIERSTRPPWPRSAKLVVAILGVIAIAGSAGSVAQLLDDDSSLDEAEVSEIIEQRDALLIENEGLSSDVALLETSNALLVADADALSAELVAAEAEQAVVSAQLTEATAQVAALTEERDALVAMFPMIVDSSLVGVDLAGTYTVAWMPAYNSGLADIALPSVRRISIRPTAEGWLQVEIPGVVTAGLSRTDGALFTMVDTTTAVPPVAGMTRLARVAITIYAGETVAAQDGTTTVTELGMSVAISAPAVGDAPAGVALYGAELTPQS